MSHIERNYKIVKEKMISQTDLSLSYGRSLIDTELDTVSNTNFTGTFYAQVLIDQNGEAESIYFNNSVNPKLDSIAIILLKNNIF